MPNREITTDELTRFGVSLEDEGPHAFDPAAEWWNESWFWDWFDATGSRAGHCRIGLHPNQGRVWLWFYSYAGGEWIALEEPRLPLSALKLPELAYDGWGLRFGWEASHPLRRGRFRCEGFGRVLSGPRTGMILPVGADLDVRAAGPPHSPGRANAPGHSSQSYPASRFEQPIEVSGRLRAGGEWQDFAGRGERDHSWGPRAWNLEWTFLAVSASDVRLQCAEARIPNVGRFPGGYLQRGDTQTIREVTFDVSLDESNVLRTITGRVAVRAEDGSELSGRIETISAAEIDLTHTLVPPRRPLYRRAFVRVHREGGGEPLLGWLEFNRLPEGS